MMTFDDQKPVGALQAEVDQWIADFGVRYFNELTNMAQLSEEVGEVARIIARRYGEQSEKESDKNKDLGEELADVLFVTLCLANQTGTDLQAAFDRRMAAKGARASASCEARSQQRRPQMACRLQGRNRLTRQRPPNHGWWHGDNVLYSAYGSAFTQNTHLPPHCRGTST